MWIRIFKCRRGGSAALARNAAMEAGVASTSRKVLTYNSRVAVSLLPDGSPAPGMPTKDAVKTALYRENKDLSMCNKTLEVCSLP